jgi:hypothetical protein
MRALGNHLGARTICLALVAGLLSFETALALVAGAVGMPGLVLVRLSHGNDDVQAVVGAAGQDGGETVVAKLADIAASAPQAQQPEAAESKPGPPAGEPNLAGLAEAPRIMPWDQEAKPDEKPENRQKAFSPDAKGREELPWDAVEPFPPPSATGSIASVATAAEPAPAPAVAAPKVQARLPTNGVVEGWVKAKATKIKGEDRERPLYHFELWLDAPPEVKQRLVAVSYDFNTAAVMPQMQISSEQNTGFRVSVGGLACADKITVTLRFKDGQSQRVAVDGCRLLAS